MTLQEAQDLDAYLDYISNPENKNLTREKIIKSVFPGDESSRIGSLFTKLETYKPAILQRYLDKTFHLTDYGEEFCRNGKFMKIWEEQNFNDKIKLTEHQSNIESIKTNRLNRALSWVSICISFGSFILSVYAVIQQSQMQKEIEVMQVKLKKVNDKMEDYDALFLPGNHPTIDTLSLSKKP